jgi:hypothetical protein
VDYTNQALKAGAGLMLAKGCTFEQVEEVKRIMTLTLITSRKKYLEEKSKSN